MNNKVTLAMGIGIVLLVLATLSFYILGAGAISLQEYGMMGVVLLLVAGATVIVAMNYRNIRAGLPAKDERSRLIDMKASRYGFMAAIWIALGTAWMGDYITLPWRYNSYIIMLGAGLVFVFSYIILYYRGSA